MMRGLRQVVEDVSIGCRIGASEAPRMQDAFEGGPIGATELVSTSHSAGGAVVLLADSSVSVLARAANLLATHGRIPGVACMIIG